MRSGNGGGSRARGGRSDDGRGLGGGFRWGWLALDGGLDQRRDGIAELALALCLGGLNDFEESELPAGAGARGALDLGHPWPPWVRTRSWDESATRRLGGRGGASCPAGPPRQTTFSDVGGQARGPRERSWWKNRVDEGSDNGLEGRETNRIGVGTPLPARRSNRRLMKGRLGGDKKMGRSALQALNVTRRSR